MGHGTAVGGDGCRGNASAILLDRGPDMVYDNVLNITWVRDASLCVTLNNCVNRNDGFVTGGMTWSDANAWAANLVFGGFHDWRLPYASVNAGAGPTITVVDCATATESQCRDNEMRYMFYYDLGGTSGQNKTGTQTAVGGQVLTGIQPIYWSGTELFPGRSAWDFIFIGGIQIRDFEDFQFSAWAVRPGDVIAAAPEPASLLLIGVGMLGLGWSRRRVRRGA
jgi:PEP-CTERM motif-containing protein